MYYAIYIMQMGSILTWFRNKYSLYYADVMEERVIRALQLIGLYINMEVDNSVVCASDF
jgi:hypothetical protein